MSEVIPKTCSDCPVFQKSLFKDFNQDLILWLANKKHAINLVKKDFLFHQGEKVDGIYCHLQGLARVRQLDSGGKQRFSRLVLPGDTSGHRSLFIETTYKGSAEVISDSLQACFIPKSDVLYLLSDSAAFAKNLIVKISTELTRSEEETISVKEHNVRSRLAQLLYELSLNFSEKIDDTKFLLRSEVPKKDIAGLLLVADETIIRLMSEMKTDGLISYQNKKIVINNLEELKKACRFNT